GSYSRGPWSTTSWPCSVSQVTRWRCSSYDAWSPPMWTRMGRCSLWWGWVWCRSTAGQGRSAEVGTLGPGALELVEAGGAGDQQAAVPESAGVLALGRGGDHG